jgi:hypothetical protein
MDGQNEFDDILKNKIDSQEFPFDETNWEKASAMIDTSRNLLRNKFDSQEFPFDEANWKKASAMIDASRKVKEKPVAIYVISALLMLVLGVSGYFLLKDTNTPSPDSTPLASNSMPAQLNANPNQETINTNKAAAISENNDKTPPSSLNPGETVSSPVTSETSASATHKKTIAQPGTAPGSNNSSDERPVSQLGSNANVSTAAQVNINMNKKTTPLSKEEPQPGEKTTGDIAAAGSPAKTTEDKKETKNNSLKKGKILEDLKPVDTEDKNGTSTNEPLTETKPITNESIIPGNQITTPIVLDSATAIPSLSKNPVLIDTLTPSLTASPIVKVDTASRVAQESKFKTEKDPVNFIYFEGGTNYLVGWKNLDEKDANGFNPVFGLHYFHMFKKNIGITVGAQYNCVGNLNYSSHTSTVTHYDFGKVNDVTIITPTKIHYASAAVKLNYTIRKNNIFGIGCNVSYLLNVDNKVETYNQREDVISERQISKTNGYVDGFNTIDVQAAVSYRRILYKDFGANIELFYGLTDVKTKGFFNTNFFARNTGMKLTLTYNIFKK